MRHSLSSFFVCGDKNGNSMSYDRYKRAKGSLGAVALIARCSQVAKRVTTTSLGLQIARRRPADLFSCPPGVKSFG